MAYNGKDVRLYHDADPVSETNPLPVTSITGVLVPEAFDYILATYPTTSSEVYTYKSGGSGGTTVATVTVVYTDSTKEVLTSVTKT